MPSHAITRTHRPGLTLAGLLWFSATAFAQTQVRGWPLDTIRDRIRAVAAGSGFDLVLQRDGTVVGWGDNDVGRAGPPAGLNNVAAIAAGREHGLALKRDGTVTGWGSNMYTPPHQRGSAASSRFRPAHSTASP